MTAFTKSVLKKIHNKRTALGYSQECIAFQLGITQGAYGRIERGETALTTDRLSQIAEVLGIDVLTLVI